MTCATKLGMIKPSEEYAAVPRTDLILIHAPSVYDFRHKTILYGPCSDQVPSSPIFELYPIGFTSIADYLERAGFRVRIVNLAVRMLQDPRFDAERLIRELDAPAFGIDLHWLLHCHGSIEVAKIVKRHHPDSKVIFGGLSASYFHRQLIEYPEIDCVVRGDSAEEPLRQLMKCIVKGAEPTQVPNLTWRDSAGEIWENPFTHVPDDLSKVMVNYYNNMLRSVVRYRDLNSSLPFRHWLRYPITAVLTCRGCTHNCIICGGSCAAFRQCYNRERPAFRKPEAVARDVKNISRFSNGPIFVLGDLMQAGEEYAYKLLKLLKRNKVRNRLILELFGPAPREFIKKMGESCPGFCLEISPESHDPEIRNACGRNYSTEALEDTIAAALQAGCSRMDIFFMFGLPRQTPQSAMQTVDYCRHLFETFQDRRIFPFTAPLSPFLDPGSLAFENPERYGYRLLFRTLEEHRQALLAPSWKYTLNYETQWMSRAELVESTYNAELALSRLKANYGIITRQQASETIHRLYTAIEMMQEIDKILASGKDQGKQLAAIKDTVDWVNMSRAGGKQELELPVKGAAIKPLGALRSILIGR